MNEDERIARKILAVARAAYAATEDWTLDEICALVDILARQVCIDATDAKGAPAFHAVAALLHERLTRFGPFEGQLL